MEGALNKWTNVVKGWQYRWFVLHPEGRLLIYYTSKEKRERDERRGVFHLFDAQVGIDEEFDTIFSITVDNKIFHFQAKDVDERNQWLEALQKCKNPKSSLFLNPSQTPNDDNNDAYSSDFDRKIAEADAYLAMLMNQQEKLDERLRLCDSQHKEICDALRIRIDNIMESIKQSIVCLQHARHLTVTPPHDNVSLVKSSHRHPRPAATHHHDTISSHHLSRSSLKLKSGGAGGSGCNSNNNIGAAPSAVVAAGGHPRPSSSSITTTKKESSSSSLLSTSIIAHSLSRSSLNVFQRSSLIMNPSLTGGGRSMSTLALTSSTNEDIHEEISSTFNQQDSSIMPSSSSSVLVSSSLSPPPPQPTATVAPAAVVNTNQDEQNELHISSNQPPTPQQQDLSSSDDDDDEDSFYDTVDYVSTSLENHQLNDNNNSGSLQLTEDFPLDELYDVVDEEDLGNIQQHGSVIMYLLGQLRIGMDLTKISLPTFILEKRSTLEMYADFLAHADLWVDIGDAPTPQERLVACVRWYLSAFHAGRKSSVAKKPYNPILGEVFQCFWDVPGSCTSDEEKSHSSMNDNRTNRPVPWAPNTAVVFVSEQVSHHPPISAFYAEHRAKQMSVNGFIWTKSKFLGLSLCVEMVGQTVISLLKYNEDYVFSFPCGYGRNILNVPWIELGGKVTITCAKTGYYANVEFRTKPFYGGKKDQIRADCFSRNDKKPFLTIEGEWNQQMWAKQPDGTSYLFVDTKAVPVLHKRVKPRENQKENESRRLWQEVTQALKDHNIDAATKGKQFLEQRQRDEAKYRVENNIPWETRLFHHEEDGQKWLFNEPLKSKSEDEKKDKTHTV